jgi:LmbE family N-acetylglucosaminyl deacetylase
MSGSSENGNPQALVNAPAGEVARRVVRAMRKIKPDVVITHDPSGGYGHPDHVAVHNAVVSAFEAAGDPEKYPGEGVPFGPRKLYFTVRPKRLMRLRVRMMPLFGQDPKRSGRNRDVDLTRIAQTEYPVNAGIKISKQAEGMRMAAISCHRSQGGGRPRTTLLDSVIGVLARLGGNKDYYMRAYPPPGKKEKDLLAGLS